MNGRLHQIIAQQRVADLHRDARRGALAATAQQNSENRNMTDDRTRAPVVTALFDVVAPIALYYGLRAAGAGIYLALVAGAVAPGISTLVRLTAGHTVDGLATFVMTTMLLGIGVSLIDGSPRFLLAKEGWVTGVAGVWFLVSVRRRRPLAFLFARPLLEGSRAFTNESWDSLWEGLPQFRQAWRTSSSIWGVGLLLDAVIRVVIAYSLPIDLVSGRRALPGDLPRAAGDRSDQLPPLRAVADPHPPP